MNGVRWGLALLITGALAPGCSVIVDGAIEDRDGGSVAADCVGAVDGSDCGGGRICVAEVCALSRCGDGVVDMAIGEDCDDANETALDGCEDDCEFTCSADADCDDGAECTGAEVCGSDHLCVEGTPLATGDACTQLGGEPGVCRDITCVPAGCGDGTVQASEDCDDTNAVDGDGCESDCTFTCASDAECDDMSVCTGTETCALATHTCVTGTALACDDSVACTSNECDPVAGCVFPLIDADADGHASTELGACGDDCNDARDDVYTGAAELCGDALDSDCDGANDPDSTPFWYLDCDGDGYAAPGAVSQQRCDAPAPTGCGGGWTPRVPVVGDRSTADCNDSNANVRPSQAMYFSSAIAGAPLASDYDYDCDATEERRYTGVSAPTSGGCEFDSRRTCTTSRFSRDGWTGATAPVCGAEAQYSSCGLGRCIGIGCERPCTRLLLDRMQTCL